MTQEEKELLLKDICARLPYNVKVSYERIPPPGWKMSDTRVDGYLNSIEPNWSITNGYQPHIICSGTLCGIGDVKPYLRPMSSMTDKEKNEFESLGWRIDELNGNTPWNHNSYNVFNGVDWLNAHHFDYRGLIERGLAIEAPEDMYSIN